MNWLLDTSVVSRYLSNRAAPDLVARIDSARAANAIAICTITVFEQLRGFRRLELEGRGEGRRKRQVFERLLEFVKIVPVDDARLLTWTVAAEIHALGALRKPALKFGDADLVLLAVARTQSMVLLTCDAGLVDNAAILELAEHVELVGG